MRAKGFQVARRHALIRAGHFMNHVLWDGETVMAGHTLRLDRQKKARGIQVVGVAPALGPPPQKKTPVPGLLDGTQKVHGHGKMVSAGSLSRQRAFA